MKNILFSGVCTALITPFRDNKVDFHKLEQLLERQIQHGIPAVCICGTTGEASTLSDEEKLSIIAHTVRFCKGRMKVIAGTGSNDTSHAASLSMMADTMGVDAVLCVTPYYNKTSPNGLIEHYTQIADRVHCPVILYNVPSRTGIDIPIAVYEKLAMYNNIVGVKEASTDIIKFTRIRHTCGDDFALWCGNDDAIVPTMSLGAKGVISVLSNLCPAETMAMANACQAEDFHTAALMQCQYTELIDALFCEVNPSPIKEAMNIAGFDVGKPRLPLCALTDEHCENLRATMQKLHIAI